METTGRFFKEEKRMTTALLQITSEQIQQSTATVFLTACVATFISLKSKLSLCKRSGIVSC
jgi:hypothetical protein